LFLLSGFLICHAVGWLWILKNSKDFLDNLKSRSFSQVSSIKTFDFSTLYTTLPHDKLKTRLKETIHHYASKQFHNISVVPLLLQTESLSGE
jgi:hypothetical protein